MTALLGRLVGWVGAHAKEVVVLIAVSTLVAWISVEVDRAVTGRVETRTLTDTITVEREAEESDLPDATIPEWVTEYEQPDTSDTVTDCFQVPSWLVTSPSADSGPDTTTSTSASVQSADRRPSVPKMFTRPSWRKGGPGYGIIPMTSGRPRVSVGSDRVEVPVFNRSGALTTYEYDIPQPDWRLQLEGQAVAIKNVVVATAALPVGRRIAELNTWVEVGPAYSAVVVGEVRSGLGVTVGFETRLFSTQ